MGKLMELVAQYGTRCKGSGVALEGCNFGLCGEEAARANIIKAEIAQQIAALEEKERALDWLLNNYYGMAIKWREDKYKLFIAGGAHVGSGPTPLAAVLDAMKKERPE